MSRPWRGRQAWQALLAWLLAWLLAALGLWAGTAGPASASAARPGTQLATPGCLLLPNCVSLYRYGRPGPPELVLEAAGEHTGAPLIVGVSNPANLNQDWTYIGLGTVAHYRRQELPDPLHLSAFDVSQYGSAELYQLEFSPGGAASGLCGANVGNKLMLRGCNGSRFQTLLSAARVRSRMAPPGYFYGLSAAQASVPGHHLAISGPGQAGSRIALARPGPGIGQLWQPS